MIQVFEGGIYSISSLPDLLAIKVWACQLVKNNFFTEPALVFVYPYMCNIVLAYTHCYQCIHCLILVLFRCIYHGFNMHMLSDQPGMSHVTWEVFRRPAGVDVLLQVNGCALDLSRNCQRTWPSSSKHLPMTNPKVGHSEWIMGTQLVHNWYTMGPYGYPISAAPDPLVCPHWNEVTRLSTLQRAASLCGHDPLLELVEAWNIWNCRASWWLLGVHGWSFQVFKKFRNSNGAKFIIVYLWYIYIWYLCAFVWTCSDTRTGWLNDLPSWQTTMESLRPRNVARIPWSEVEKCET